jgi:hypothetical protein
LVENLLSLLVNVSGGNWLKWYYWLVIAILVAVGISTFIPASGPKNLIGYSSVDPFAPVSGIILWVAAGLVFWLGKRKEKKP